LEANDSTIELYPQNCCTPAFCLLVLLLFWPRIILARALAAPFWNEQNRATAAYFLAQQLEARSGCLLLLSAVCLDI
jgi:hypothetical protein